jgi:hypothetical protein
MVPALWIVAIPSSPTAARAGHVCDPTIPLYLKFHHRVQASTLLLRTIPARAGIAVRIRNFNT